MSTSNRKYKDSVFVDLFSEDEKAKENFLSLYNALHGLPYIPPRMRLELYVLSTILIRVLCKQNSLIYSFCRPPAPHIATAQDVR